MAASDDFKQLIRAGNVAEALQLAFTEAIELTITTRLTPDHASATANKGTVGPQIQTRIDVLAGTVTTDVSSDIFSHETYAALGTLHSDQVREGCQVIQDNLANLQMFLSTWLEAFGKSGQWPTTPVASVSPAPATIAEPGPLSEPPIMPETPATEPELGVALEAAAIAPPPVETVPPIAAPPLLDAEEATTIEAEPIVDSVEEETFIQSQEPELDVADLSLPTPPTEETEAAAVIAMDELFGEPQDLAVSAEAVAAAARELASAGADLGFDEETFVQEFSQEFSQEAAAPPSPVAPELEFSEETVIQAEEPSPPTLEPPTAEPPAPETVAEPWQVGMEPPTADEPPAADMIPDPDFFAETADLVDDSWLQELGIVEPESQPSAEPEAAFRLEPEPAIVEPGTEPEGEPLATSFETGLETGLEMGSLGLESEALAVPEGIAEVSPEVSPEVSLDLGLESEPAVAPESGVEAELEAGLASAWEVEREPQTPIEPETDWRLMSDMAATAGAGFETTISRPETSPELATDALVDALLQADEAALSPEPSELEPIPTAPPPPESAEPDWDELSAFADTEAQPDPWEAVEAAATPDWLAEVETPTSPLATSELLEEFDPSLFADESEQSGEDLGAIDLASPAADAFLDPFKEETPATTPIAPPAAASSSGDRDLGADATFAEFDATLFPDETDMATVAPDGDIEGWTEAEVSGEIEEKRAISEPADVPAVEADLSGLFSDTAMAEAEIEDFMPTAMSEAESAPAPDHYDPLAALFDESASEDFANLLEVPDALEGEDPLAAFDVDPFAGDLDDAEEPT